MAKNSSKLHNVGGTFRFLVELDGLIVGGFSEVTGMKSEIEVKPYWEGGVNTHPHYMDRTNEVSEYCAQKRH